MPLLHMASRIRRDILIFFLDTGYHFWETHMFREQLASHWQLNVLDLYRDTRWDEFARQRTRSLPVDDPNLCCFIHKVQPMQKALKDMKAWISGIRRDQTAVRAQAKILELQDDGLLKINPLLNWTREDIKRYSRNIICRHIHYLKKAIEVSVALRVRLPLASTTTSAPGAGPGAAKWSVVCIPRCSSTKMC